MRPPFVLTIAIAFISAITNLVLVVRLRSHRVDIGPRDSFATGKYRVWQLNVFDPSNYSVTGRRLLTWLYLGTVVQAVAIAGLVVLAVKGN